ncbi:hypothetical protein [Sorangium sp. So ce362]|uniref:hypothetical protein n=1 Tax=Sorangium sp. So ce362 TaxID=3133303 RepID=UPI003F5E7086
MGPSAAYKVEGLCDGVPAPSGAEGRRQEHQSLCNAPTMPFSSHPSLVVEEPTESRPWCVDHGGWLEAMSTVALWRALEVGELAHSTRVWREGLECWTAAGEVKALGWTISQPPPPHEVPAVSAASEGPESTGPLSFALTPDDLRSVAPRHHRGGPARPRDERADAFPLGPFPLAEAAARHETPPPPISLEIPSCFPAVPSFPPDTLPSPGAPVPGAAQLGSGPARGGRDADQAPRGRASGTWSRLARRARASRSAVSLAAGSAASVLVLGLSVLSALAPATAPSRAAVAPAARLGVAQGVAAAAAEAFLPAPELAGAARAAAPSAAAPGPTPVTAVPEGARAALEGGADAPALPPQGTEKAPPAGAKPAPVGRRERGQFRLRRGRSEGDAARGGGRPGRAPGSSVGTGAILRDSR